MVLYDMRKNPLHEPAVDLRRKRRYVAEVENGPPSLVVGGFIRNGGHMATTRVYDHLMLIWDGPPRGRKRVCQWLPRREKWFYFQRGRHILLLHWAPWRGIWLVAERVGDTRAEPHTISPRSDWKMGVKKRDPMAQNGAPSTPAKAASVILAKLPALREWLTATTYEDGTARTPGKLSLEVYGTVWSVLLRDPDAAARLSIKGEDLDKTLLLVEQLLGVEEAPWERDDWLASQLAKKKKK